MSAQIYKAEKLFDGNNINNDVYFCVETGVFTDISYSSKSNAIELSGLIAPGFIDAQVNGGGGVLFNNVPTVETLKKMLSAHAQFGTTAMLPTLISDSLDTMQKSADAVAEAINKNVLGIIGIHFEGPHLSVAKKGIHPEKFIRSLSTEEMAIFSRTDLGIKLITVAPENLSSDSISRLRSECAALISIGHSNTDYETTKRALAAGAGGFTHLFNAMSQFQNRSPGVVGAALEDEASWCGIILDGHHVDRTSARIAFKAKPKGKLFLVTDAMSPVGAEGTCFPFFDTEIVRQGSKLTLPTGELAGSVLDMATAVKNAVTKLDIEVEEALRMASLYPAQFLGIDHTMGAIEVGKQANFIRLDDNLSVQQTWIDGNNIYTQKQLRNNN